MQWMIMLGSRYWNATDKKWVDRDRATLYAGRDSWKQAMLVSMDVGGEVIHAG